MSDNDKPSAIPTGLLNSSPATNPNIGSWLGGLLTGDPYKVEGQWYHNKLIHLDGYTFERCRFDSCDIHISTGNFRVNHCYFANCRFFYSGNALNLVRLYNINANEARSNWPYLAPTLNSDGTLTI